MGNKEEHHYKYNKPESAADVVMEVIRGPSYTYEGKTVKK